MKNINFEEGTLTFWIPKEAIDYKDNKFISLVNYVSDKGTLNIVKDEENGLRASYNYFGKGNCEAKALAEELDNGEKHMVAVTWSITEGLIKIYIDGEEKASCPIEMV